MKCRWISNRTLMLMSIIDMQPFENMYQRWQLEKTLSCLMLDVRNQNNTAIYNFKYHFFLIKLHSFTIQPFSKMLFDFWEEEKSIMQDLQITRIRILRNARFSREVIPRWTQCFWGILIIWKLRLLWQFCFNYPFESMGEARGKNIIRKHRRSANNY
jgi:hypothetical protein